MLCFGRALQSDVSLEAQMATPILKGLLRGGQVAKVSVISYKIYVVKNAYNEDDIANAQ